MILQDNYWISLKARSDQERFLLIKKTPNITPIFQKGKKDDLRNRRPDHLPSLNLHEGDGGINPGNDFQTHEVQEGY